VNLGRLLTQARRRIPSAPAISQGARTLSYADFDDRSDALAHALADRGLRQGDRVAVLLANAPELLETMFACFKAGYGFVPLNAKFRPDEVSYHLQDSGAAALVVDAAGGDVAVQADTGDTALIAVGDPRDGFAEYESLVQGATGRGSVAVDVDRDDVAWLFYTSGTTGRPKGAILTHGVLDFVTASWLADLTPMDERSVTLHAAPLTHGAGFHALATTARGAHHVLTPAGSFDPAGILALMRSAGVTCTWLVPTQIVMLTDHLAGRRADLPGLRHIVYGGAAFAPADLKVALEVFGPRLVQLYGQGETPMTATVLPPEDHASALAGDRSERLASAGFARPGMDVRIHDGDDRELPAGEVGEVVVRGPAVMTGYWQRPAETAAALRHGWLHTGDLGRMDERGYVYLLDRAKDMIISGGSNVYAVEVEAVLTEHPAVREVAVVGVPDRTWGELVVAVVVPEERADQPDRPLAVASPELTGQWEAHCREQLATYKRPRRYVLLDALPRNAYGKVPKRVLREQLAQQAATQQDLTQQDSTQNGSTT